MDTIGTLCGEIARRYHPQRIVLFAQKRDVGGALQSFKLCVVADAPDERGLAREICLRLDCETPYDVVVYTPRRWEELRRREGAFARRVDRTGRVLYG